MSIGGDTLITERTFRWSENLNCQRPNDNRASVFSLKPMTEITQRLTDCCRKMERLMERTIDIAVCPLKNRSDAPALLCADRFDPCQMISSWPTTGLSLHRLTAAVAPCVVHVDPRVVRPPNGSYE
ncbi:hypothetical protein NZK35_03625 [Stieleria sp. ICT_E10.1]|uniref:hypothetical protein n=1 Tax=Stieleria sedimenti TaxID=2976331 RepID=UPI00217FB330|nr:hypothetical protein [Stieleria sedimenti]MCS7465764.1 hypothetical protein [Stieleria sedimenti]